MEGSAYVRLAFSEIQARLVLVLSELSLIVAGRSVLFGCFFLCERATISFEESDPFEESQPWPAER